MGGNEEIPPPVVRQRKTGIKGFLKKLETDNEPGLTNKQLMLTNHDLKPGSYSVFYSDPDRIGVVVCSFSPTIPDSFLSFPSLHRVSPMPEYFLLPSIPQPLPFPSPRLFPLNPFPADPAPHSRHSLMCIIFNGVQSRGCCCTKQRADLAETSRYTTWRSRKKQMAKTRC